MTAIETARIGKAGFDKAVAIAAIVEQYAGQAEQDRTLPQPTVDALWQSGLLHHFNPHVAGGVEPDFADMIATWIEMARQDGSVGWIGIANCPSAAFAAAYLPDAGFAEVFESGNERITMGGQFAPNGLGTEVEGGYQLTGAWNFGSGTGHSPYVVGGFIPMRDGEMVMAADDSGLPLMMVAVMPREQITFTDNWNVMGLRGTGSYDYNVSDVFVPAARVFPLFTTEPQRGESAVYKMGVMPVTAAGHAAFAVGLARRALDEVRQLAIEKTRMGDMTTLAHRETFQSGLAHHEAMWRAAQSYITSTYSEVQARVGAGTPLAVQDRIDMRLAATYATHASREIVDFAHQAAGTAAIREGNPIERIFRDMHTATQHTFIGEKTYTESARIMLGLAADSSAI